MPNSSASSGYACPASRGLAGVDREPAEASERLLELRPPRRGELAHLLPRLQIAEEQLQEGLVAVGEEERVGVAR